MDKSTANSLQDRLGRIHSALTALSMSYTAVASMDVDVGSVGGGFECIADYIAKDIESLIKMLELEARHG